MRYILGAFFVWYMDEPHVSHFHISAQLVCRMIKVPPEWTDTNCRVRIIIRGTHDNQYKKNKKDPNFSFL